MRILPMLLLLAIPSAADANWKYSRCGMTLDELISASSGKAQKVPDRGGSRIGKSARLATSTITFAGAPFLVEFYFDDKKLAFVRHVPIPETTSCEDEEKLVVSAFGAGKVEESSSNVTIGARAVTAHAVFHFWDAEEGDSMSLSKAWLTSQADPTRSTKTFCTLLIEPKESAAKRREGLNVTKN